MHGQNHIKDSNIFMDEFVDGADDGNGAISIYYELTALMKPSNSQWPNVPPAAKK
jgi:hypothetical protein